MLPFVISSCSRCHHYLECQYLHYRNLCYKHCLRDMHLVPLLVALASNFFLPHCLVILFHVPNQCRGTHMCSCLNATHHHNIAQITGGCILTQNIF
ncbi:hypothetical protein FKM82_012072 [Ascaphus truei]